MAAVSANTVEGDADAFKKHIGPVYENINSPEQLADLLDKNHPDGSIKILILSGHGGGAGFATDQGTYVNQNMRVETAKRIAKKLSHDAVIELHTCGGGDDRGKMERLAEKLEATVKGPTGDCRLFNPKRSNITGEWRTVPFDGPETAEVKAARDRK